MVYGFMVIYGLVVFKTLQFASCLTLSLSRSETKVNNWRKLYSTGIFFFPHFGGKYFLIYDVRMCLCHLSGWIPFFIELRLHISRIVKQFLG